MKKAHTKMLLGIYAGEIRRLTQSNAALTETLEEWETRFNSEVSRRKSAQAEWEAAQELSSRLEGS